jgi:hypothetical protein
MSDITLTEALDLLPVHTRDQVTATLAETEYLRESLADAELALEDRGWARVGHTASTQFSRAGLGNIASLSQAMVCTNVLIRRGVNLRTAYVWGGGVEITGRHDATNAVLQGFVDDVGNQAAVFGEQACEENERSLSTDGNVFIAAVTAPRTGRVQVRTIPFDEITDVLRNPDDRDDPWFYKREWTAEVVAPVRGDDGVVRTVTDQQQRTVWYPALGHRPAARPRQIDGHEVRWDSPVLQVSVNRLNGWKFGVGDVYVGMAWARAYAEFLRDWALLMKSLAKFAWRQTARGSKASQAAAKIRAYLPDPDAPAGAAVTSSPDVTLEAIPKSGATLDSESGRPLAAMVAAAFDLPVTMLLGDPGVTGARATAETLDNPTELAMLARRRRWTQALQRLCWHVLVEAVRAPAGPLRGVVTRDELGREQVTLAAVDGDDVDPGVDVTWPDLTDEDVKAAVEAVVAADGTGKLPGEVVARLLLQKLKVDDVDGVLDGMRDADGNWVDPELAAALQGERLRDQGADAA